MYYLWKNYNFFKQIKILMKSQTLCLAWIYITHAHLFCCFGKVNLPCFCSEPKEQFVITLSFVCNIFPNRCLNWCLLQLVINYIFKDLLKSSIIRVRNWHLLGNELLMRSYPVHSHSLHIVFWNKNKGTISHTAHLRNKCKSVNTFDQSYHNIN